MSNWNSAYAWGDHASAGYLKSESDPKVSSTIPNRVPVFDGTALRDSSIYEGGGMVGINVTTTPAAFFQVGDLLPLDFDVLDIDQNAFNFSTSGTTQWQSFIPTAAGNLVRISVYKNTCATLNGTLSVYLGEGIGGALLHSQPYSLGDCAGWRNFDLTSPVPVLAGTKYTFSLQGDDFRRSGMATARPIRMASTSPTSPERSSRT